jgi:hypothetical protein
MSQVGIVIPTIFSRPALLPAAAGSLRTAGDCYVLVSSPEPSEQSQVELIKSLQDELLIDATLIETSGLSLGEKITEALESLPDSCEYIGWLGDDDILLPGALKTAADYLDQNPDCVMVYGGVDYINPDGQVLFTNPSSQFHSTLLSFGPQLIPQPGALWRRSAFEGAGGLSGEFNLAFDFDLFLKLKKVGKLHHLPVTLAQFRWHPDSLSVKKRWVSVSEASKVRRKHYGFPMSVIWPLWEPIVMSATWLAGKLVSFKYLRSK